MSRRYLFRQTEEHVHVEEDILYATQKLLKITNRHFTVLLIVRWF